MHLVESERRLRCCDALYAERPGACLNWTMRAIMVDWLVEVCLEFELSANTLHLAVNYLDRVFSQHHVERSSLQLIGIVCLWIAAKYEDVACPTCKDMCSITADTYPPEKLLKTEKLVLQWLDYGLHAPTSCTFVELLLTDVPGGDVALRSMARYLAELSLMNHVMLRHPPSVIAMSSVRLASMLLRREVITEVEHPDVAACTWALASTHAHTWDPNLKTKAIKEKYAEPGLGCVSIVYSPAICQVDTATFVGRDAFAHDV